MEEDEWMTKLFVESGYHVLAHAAPLDDRFEGFVNVMRSSAFLHRELVQQIYFATEQLFATEHEAIDVAMSIFRSRVKAGTVED